MPVKNTGKYFLIFQQVKCVTMKLYKALERNKYYTLQRQPLQIKTKGLLVGKHTKAVFSNAGQSRTQQKRTIAKKFQVHSTS